jgi:hypothetical protein
VKDYAPHFRAMLEDQLPDDARVLMPRGPQDMVMLASWRLRDPLRPAKRSRMIRIVISQEAIQDYARRDEALRLASDTRFIDWIQRQLKSFDPNHNAPLGVEPAPVTWNLPTLLLNGSAG